LWLDKEQEKLKCNYAYIILHVRQFSMMLRFIAKITYIKDWNAGHTKLIQTFLTASCVTYSTITPASSSPSSLAAAAAAAL